MFEFLDRLNWFYLLSSRTYKTDLSVEFQDLQSWFYLSEPTKLILFVEFKDLKSWCYLMSFRTYKT